MAQLYALHLQPFFDEKWRFFLPELPPERQKSVEICRFDADKARKTGAGWLLQHALLQAGVPKNAQIFAKNDLGKPFLTTIEDIHFSLSHSGNWAVCAVSHDPVGVDVEQPRCTIEIARRFFQPQELEGLDQLPEPQCRDQLNRLWTAKEAFVKALGGGLTIPLSSFSVLLQANDAVLEQTLSPLPYRLHEYRLEDARVCLCCTEEKPDFTQITP